MAHQQSSITLNPEQQAAIARYDEAISLRYSGLPIAIDEDEEADAFAAAIQALAPTLLYKGVDPNRGLTSLAFLARAITETALLKALGVIDSTHIEYRDLNEDE